MTPGTPVSRGLYCARRWLVLAAVAMAVGSYYLWALRAPGYRFDWKVDQGGYYNYLARAFAHGRLELPLKPSPELLALPNPWDPSVDDSLKMHDMALYNGRYYLYHGPGPAVMLFTPWLLITGHDLPERFALFVFCFGGFLFSCAVLIQWLDLAGAKVGLPLLASMFLALGICQAIPYLLSRVWVYEVAIGAGYFCISAALFFLTLGIRTDQAYWFGVSGLMFGLAISCRPHLGLAGLAALAGLAIIFVRSRRLPVALVSFAGAFALAGAAIALYNYQRFDNPFEFGVRYLLAGPNQNRIRLARENVLPGLYFWLACHPDIDAVFPWVRLAFRYPFHSPAHPFPPQYFIEATAGAFFLAPFIAGSFLIPFTGTKTKEGLRTVKVLSWTVAVFSCAVLLFLAGTGFTTQRYTVDFLPPLVLVALANFAVYIERNRGPRRILLQATLIALIAWAIVANLALGISGPYDDMLRNRPVNYLRIARWFSPVERFRPVLNAEIDMKFTAEFVPVANRISEPLLTLGRQAYRYFLYAERSPGKLRIVSKSEASTATRDLPDWENMRAQIEVRFDSGRMVVHLNGQEILNHEVGILVSAPSQIKLGENPIDPAVTGERFTGSIYDVSRRR